MVATTVRTGRQILKAIARQSQIIVNAQAFWKTTPAAPFFEHVMRNFLPPDEFSIFGGELQYRARQKPELLANRFWDGDLGFLRQDGIHTYTVGIPTSLAIICLGTIQWYVDNPATSRLNISEIAIHLWEVEVKGNDLLTKKAENCLRFFPPRY